MAEAIKVTGMVRAPSKLLLLLHVAPGMTLSSPVHAPLGVPRQLLAVAVVAGPNHALLILRAALVSRRVRKDGAAAVALPAFVAPLCFKLTVVARGVHAAT